MRLETWSVIGCRGVVVPAIHRFRGTHALFKSEKRSLLKPGSRQSPGKGAYSVAFKLFTVLAIGQLAALGYRDPRPAILAPAVAVGDDLSPLVIRDSGGETIELGAGHRTLLLVFDPDCPHTDRVAEAWAAWLDEEESEAHRTIAVSSGAPAAVAQYVRDKRWNVRVGTVEPAEDGKSDHVLMKRTPWVFVVGGDGEVVAEGHGIRLAEVAQIIRTAPAKRART